MTADAESRCGPEPAIRVFIGAAILRDTSMLVIDMNPKNYECVVCGNACDGTHGVPMLEGELVSNEWEGEWVGRHACIDCFHKHARNELPTRDAHDRVKRERRLVRKAMLARAYQWACYQTSLDLGDKYLIDALADFAMTFTNPGLIRRASNGTRRAAKREEKKRRRRLARERIHA